MYIDKKSGGKTEMNNQIDHKRCLKENVYQQEK